MKTIHLASAASANYLPGLEVLVASTLLHANANAAIHFHIFGEGFTEKDWASLSQLATKLHAHTSIHRLQFSEERLAGFPAFNGHKITYARMFLGECLPHVTKVVYLDSDILIGRDVQELLDLDMSGRTGLAADDALLKRLDEDCPWLPEEISRSYRYFNAGVLVLDLERWRKLDYLGQCLAALASSPQPCRYCDQTTLNYVLRDDMGSLAQVYNHFSYFTENLPATGANYHLVSAKPWLTHAHRFDHYLWRAFYEEVIDPAKNWRDQGTLKDRVFNWLPFNRATKWFYVLTMHVLIAAANHAHQRKMREQSLRTALDSPPLLALARAQWRTRHASIRSTPRSLSHAELS